MKKITIKQFKEGALEEIEDTIAEDTLLHLIINSDVSFDVSISPIDIKEFVYGNLFTEGFIHDKVEVTGYKEKIKNKLILVNVKVKAFSEKKKFLKKNYNIVWTECGSSSELTRLTDQFSRFKDLEPINGRILLNISKVINDKIELFKLTGAFHYAFLFDRDIDLVSYSYDIGRHNAVDKVLGHQLLSDGCFHDKVLYTTGRISSDIVLKCLRAKVSVLISRGAPFTSAVNLAKKYNICLIGFLRGKRFNIYSNFDAIKIE